MAATLTQERFATSDWIFERKFDGIRLIAFKEGADVRLFSRNRLPQHLPAIAEAITGVPAAKASVKTIPKLSPESDGAQRTSARWSSAQRLSPETRPRISIHRNKSGSAT